MYCVFSFFAAIPILNRLLTLANRKMTRDLATIHDIIDEIVAEKRRQLREAQDSPGTLGLCH